jgi:glucosamine-6-phosphate deaminase
MISIQPNEATFDYVAAMYVVEKIRSNRHAVIGLSTGNTTGGMHRIIAQVCKINNEDLSGITLFALDEVVNIPRSYAGSCYTKLRNELIDDLGLRDEQFLALPVELSKYPEACLTFQNELKRRGGIDLLVLGLGMNGHLGFNQPYTPFETETCLTAMDDELEARIRRETDTPADAPLYGATLGLLNIMHARQLLLVAKGEHKRAIVKQMLEGKITPAIPASILRLHPDCTFLFQENAFS